MTDRIQNAFVAQPAGASVEAHDAARYRVTTLLAALACAAAPAYAIRWHVGPLPTTLLEVTILVTIAAFFVETVRAGGSVRWRTSLTVPALLLIIAGALDVMFAPDRRAALGLYRAYFLEPIAFAVVLLSIIGTLRRAYLVLFGLGLGALVAALANAAVVVHAIAQHRLDLGGTPPVVIYQTANALALFLLPLIAVALSVFLYGDGQARLASAVFLLVAVPSFLLSFSRGGYVALAAVAVALALTHQRRRWYLAGVAVVGIAFALIPPITKRLAYELNFADPHNTLVGRIPLWQATLDMLGQHPLFGAGLSGFADRIAPFWNATHADRFIYPHNLVLNFWVATGILGVVAFAWLLVLGFRQTWRGWRLGDRRWRPLHLGVLLALIGIVVHGLVDVPYFKNDLSLEFWVLLAIAWSASRIGQTPSLSQAVRQSGEVPRRRLA